MVIDKIKVVYCTNYNGVSLFAVECDDDWKRGRGRSMDELDDYTANLANDVVDTLASEFVEECDEDGEFMGDEDDTAERCKEEVKAVFGDHVEVRVEFDNHST